MILYIVLILFVVIAIVISHQQMRFIGSHQDSFRLNKMFNSKNTNGAIEKFYNEAINAKPDIPKKADDDIRLATYNCHVFQSINAADSDDDAIKDLFSFMKTRSVDIIAVQEYSPINVSLVNELIKDMKLYSTNVNEYGLLVLSRVPFEHMIESGDNRPYIIANVLDYKIAIIHLSLKPRDYTKPDSAAYKRAVNETRALHMSQLEKIISENPDIILGDFNFTPDDPEYKVLKDAGYKADFDKPTTPFGTTVDFIFTKSTIPKMVWTDYAKYTDHRPVIADITGSWY